MAPFRGRPHRVSPPLTLPMQHRRAKQTDLHNSLRTVEPRAVWHIWVRLWDRHKHCDLSVARHWILPALGRVSVRSKDGQSHIRGRGKRECSAPQIPNLSRLQNGHKRVRQSETSHNRRRECDRGQSRLHIIGGTSNDKHLSIALCDLSKPNSKSKSLKIMHSSTVVSPTKYVCLGVDPRRRGSPSLTFGASILRTLWRSCRWESVPGFWSMASCVRKYISKTTHSRLTTLWSSMEWFCSFWAFWIPLIIGKNRRSVRCPSQSINLDMSFIARE